MTAQHIECTMEAYHARDEWGRSQLEDAVGEEGSWPLFHGLHVAKPPLFERKRSTALDVGTVAHACLTSPGGINSVVAQIPDEALNGDGHRKGAAWKEWKEEHAGMICMKPEELSPIRHMVRNTWAHPEGAWLLEHALHFEFTLVYECPMTGLMLRARPDIVAAFRGRVILCDFKTTKCRTPRQFAHDAEQFGYHRQLAWYIEALELFGYEVVRWVMLTVDKSPAHLCRAYELPEHAIDLGRKQNHEGRVELARRLEMNDWTDPLGQHLMEVDLPRRAYDEEGLAV